MEKLSDYKKILYFQVYVYDNFEEFNKHSKEMEKDGFYIMNTNGINNPITYPENKIRVNYTKEIKEV
jgi:hypothetical protein